jgi:hypothetical protein
MANFSSSPSFGNSYSYSRNWPSKDAPADDGSCGQNVAVAVLESFDIPYIGSPPPRGNLCGLDINNMPASDAIQLSLAENMKDGDFYEMYTNADGFAYFQKVYPNPETADIEIRTCIPTSNVDQKVDLVIVRGYDTPPVRSFKDFVSVEWLETDSLSNYVNYCPMFSTEAWRSYKDPVLETSYKDGAENLYELQEFESLVGYVIDFDGKSDQNIKYSFSGTTLKNVLLDTGATGLNYYGGSVKICDETSGVGDVSFNGFYFPISSFNATDKFGESWPLLLNVQGVYAIVHDISSVSLGPWGTIASTGATSGNYKALYTIERKSKFVQLPATNWHWELNPDTSANIYIYSRTPTETESNYVVGRYPELYVWSDEGQVDNVGNRSIDGLGGLVMPNLGGSWIVLLKGLWATVELDRPSVHVTDPTGNAIETANALELKYQPIIVTDTPAPVAYTFGGAAELVDHTLDLYDSDPSTQQDPPASVAGSLSWLQTQTTGRTVDISLPFCDESDCKAMASTIYGLQNENITSYNMVCGPTKHPKLGTRVPGYEGRINKISYSYTDSSAYNISITVGNTFQNAKGWQTSIWQQKTEDVSREAIVTWSAGNGVDYRVKVSGGLGVYPAINKTQAAYNPGEKVSVTIYNNPVEK